VIAFLKSATQARANLADATLWGAEGPQALAKSELAPPGSLPATSPCQWGCADAPFARSPKHFQEETREPRPQRFLGYWLTAVMAG
jgi:hypothetical protein